MQIFRNLAKVLIAELVEHRFTRSCIISNIIANYI